MDAAAFDALSRVFSAPAPRRRLLGLAASLPLLGGVAAWLDADDGAARERRRRRKQRHQRRKRPGARKPHCKPQGKGKICAGTCGPVKSRRTCGKTVDCGSCDCPAPCGECFICQGGPSTPGACVPDPAQVGEPCGSDGQVCAANGGCACEAGTCANPAPICVDGACAACAASGDCLAEQMGDLCCAGSCYDGVCCDDDGCLTDAAPDCVDHACVCAGNGNAACTGDEVCCADGCANLQTDPDHCGDCAEACPATKPFCVAGVCTPCSASRLCPNGLFCQTDGSCVASCTVCQTASAGLCVNTASLNHTCTSPCPSGEWCDAGQCAAIAATVNLIDCQSVCGGSATVCGETVTCPSCGRCSAQTGCSANTLQDGPLGPGTYCSLSNGGLPCTTNAECAAPYAYCNTGSGGGDHCVRICPFS